ncbi:MAG: MBL fold metallo-hydrolase [Prevotellaceae bacterium]|jgi:L-ascorbate metabolism protein UlaG (beta-lactamase superfamily)|nr:MBL fold metallo-hydrolase [Prevotellaceae bacterium]
MISQKLLLYIIFTIVGIILLTIFSCSAIKSTGKYPNKKEQAKFALLPNYKDGSFWNLYKRTDTLDRSSIPKSAFRKERSSRFKKPRLSESMPSIKTDLKGTIFNAPTVIWFGHSSYLISYKDFNILVDPVFSGYGSPISFVNRNFEGSNIYQVEDLPPIDILIITHDHYDHLDYKTVKKLRKKGVKAIVPMGVKRTLKSWKYKEEKIAEVSWGDSLKIQNNITLVSTPAQHFSGRRFKRNKTLWSSYVLALYEYKIFIGGDGGYNKHFEDIGKQYGPFDIAILENGQYSQYWTSSHCYPEQTAQAAIDLNTHIILPVHWAKFSATYHPWNEPIKRLLHAADSLGVQVTVPRIGEPYTIGDKPMQEVWWNFD